jgi:zinc protease
VVERREVADLKTTFLRFDNGVRLTVRPSTVRKDEVLVAARVGEGELDLARDRPSPAWLANATFTEGGLGRMTAEEIEEALAAEVYGLNLSIDDDAFVLTGRTRPQDLDTQMQVLAAHLTDPAWRPQGYERMRAYSANVHDQVESTPGGVLGRDLGRLIRSGDRRWGLPSRQEMASARLEELTRVLNPALAGEAIEVVVTGDVTVEEAVRQTAATFGALPPRREPSHPAAATQVRFPQGSATPVRLTHKGRPDQAMAYIAWPTTDFVSDPQQARVLRVMEQVMKLRLTDEVREAQGVTYSPITSYDAAWVYPGFGYVAAGIEAPPTSWRRSSPTP